MGEAEIYIYIKSLDKWTGWREVYLFICFFKTESEKKQWGADSVSPRAGKR